MPEFDDDMINTALATVTAEQWTRLEALALAVDSREHERRTCLR